MGSHVSETIRKGIADYECFVDDPEILMYGCIWVLFSVGAWLFIASYLEMPVSTTHSCIGCMIGMTWVLKGHNCVKWYSQTDTFPWIGGVSGIVLSWFISPIFSSLVSMFLYSIIRHFVLRHPFTSKRIYYVYPLLVGSTITLNTLFIIYKGAKGLKLHNIQLERALSISFGSGGLIGLIIIPFIPKLYRHTIKTYRRQNTIAQLSATREENNSINVEIIPASINYSDNSRLSEREKKNVMNIHNNVEKFDNETEDFFKYIQIITAICCAFSHGANDVANAIGPFAALYTIYKTGNVESNSVMDNNAYWILGYGGIGISLGLLVYEYKIRNAMGTKLCKITPSRGSIIELSSAVIIIIGSRLKIPLSTTHCQVGETLGVGLLENRIGNMSGINSRLMLKIGFGWAITCVIVGSTTALLVAQGIYSS